MHNMEIKINNILGCTNLELETAKKMIMFVGANGAGKSSVIKSLQEASVITKGASKILKKGAGTGEVSISTGRHDYTLSTKKGQINPMPLGLIGAGKVTLWDQTPAEKAEELSILFGFNPSYEELQAEVKSEFSDEQLSKCWQRITTNGWDSAAGYYADTAKAKKGAWRQITGENWGSTKAAQWGQDDERDSLQKLDGDLTLAQERVDYCIANKALDNDKTNQWKAAVKAWDDEKERIYTLARDNLTIKYTDYDNAVKKSKELAAMVVYRCPGCLKTLILKDGALIHSNAIPTDEEKAEAQNLVTKLSTELDSLKNAIADQEKIKVAAGNAKYDLSQMTDTDEKISETELENARIQLEQITEKRDDAVKSRDAKKVHDTITILLFAADVLKADGLRKKVLTKKISEVNAAFSALTGVFVTKEIKINDSLELSYDGIDYDFISESEKWRVDVLTQILFSQNAPFLLVDRFDVLDKTSRMTFLKGLLSLTVEHVMVGMTAIDNQVPKSNDLIEVCNIENGVLS